VRCRIGNRASAGLLLSGGQCYPDYSHAPYRNCTVPLQAYTAMADSTGCLTTLAQSEMVALVDLQVGRRGHLQLLALCFSSFLESVPCAGTVGDGGAGGPAGELIETVCSGGLVFPVLHFAARDDRHAGGPAGALIESVCTGVLTRSLLCWCPRGD
jgi:hypothetical protein